MEALDVVATVVVNADQTEALLFGGNGIAGALKPGTVILSSATMAPARAKALAMTAEPIDAKTAESWGMIWKAVADDQLHAEATALAERLAKGATVAMGLAKLAIQESAGAGYEEHLMAEAEYQRQAGLTPDFVEGVSAVLQKRPPNFKGVR